MIEHKHERASDRAGTCRAAAAAAVAAARTPSPPMVFLLIINNRNCPTTSTKDEALPRLLRLRTHRAKVTRSLRALSADSAWPVPRTISIDQHTTHAAYIATSTRAHPREYVRFSFSLKLVLSAIAPLSLSLACGDGTRYNSAILSATSRHLSRSRSLPPRRSLSTLSTRLHSTTCSVCGGGVSERTSETDERARRRETSRAERKCAKMHHQVSPTTDQSPRARHQPYRWIYSDFRLRWYFSINCLTPTPHEIDLTNRSIMGTYAAQGLSLPRQCDYLLASPRWRMMTHSELACATTTTTTTGNIFTSLFGSLFGQQDVRILILGLDGAGKTTVRAAPLPRRWRRSRAKTCR